MLCESCGENPATVFVAQVVNGDVSKMQLCESCARERAGDAADVSVEDIMRDLLAHLDEDAHDSSDSQSELFVNEIFFSLGEFPGDEDLADEMDEDEFEDETEEQPGDAEESTQNDFDGASLPHFAFDEPRERREISAKRCPKCSITWDRLRQDGRAGCARCYETFAEQLRDVMQRVQQGPAHTGKRPRAAEKRRRRLEQLRAKRDNRLEMLNRRLQEAVQEEHYEEAAKLRDQIRIVSSTIVKEI